MIKSIGRLYSLQVSVVHQVTRSASKLPFTPNHNIGVQRRLKVLAEVEPDIENTDINHETVEEFEQDFLQAGEMHNEITSDVRRISKAHQYKITERKHFRPPKEPNMLTWSEKEQIRFLHQSDPDKWIPEILAESFPASPAIIKKLLKAKWKPRNVERLKEHDTQVSDNWKAFHRGKLDVHDLRLKIHLEKFTDRKGGVKIISDDDAKKVTEVILPKPKNTEFLSLITSYRRKNDVEQVDMKTKQIEGNHQANEAVRSRDPLSMMDRSKANYTLEQFKKRLVDEVDKLSETPAEIKAIIGKNKKDVENGSPIETYVAPSERFVTDAIVRSNKYKTHLFMVDPNNLPNKITIPKELWKAGLVYRVSDCFYNDEGLFLYRVPGLKAN